MRILYLLSLVLFLAGTFTKLAQAQFGGHFGAEVAVSGNQVYVSEGAETSRAVQ